MESAQFGMGASIDMMQQQVDLAYEIMKTQEDADRQYREQAKLIKNITDAFVCRNFSTALSAESPNGIRKIILTALCRKLLWCSSRWDWNRNWRNV